MEWTDADYEVGVREACERLGVASPDCAVWVAPIVRRNDERGEAARPMIQAICGEGPTVSKEELRSLGIKGGMKYGRRFLEALTERGLENPEEVASAIAHHAHFRLSRLRDLKNIARSRSGLGRVVVFDGNRTCAASKLLRGEVMAPDRLPAFPLPGCDQPICLCGYEVYFPKRGGTLPTGDGPALMPEPSTRSVRGARAPKAPRRDGSPLAALSRAEDAIRTEQDRKTKAKDTALGCLVVVAVIAAITLWFVL